ncbi:MAG TPA: 2-isopropylmalate synthase [Anaerolineales bacterium]|nr:2-isopropylmalate synthase [Anaerolineales bacterium]
MDNYVKIFDTTLRDGEQSPGATMTSAEKLEVARSLASLGVDIIEAGFPAASPDDLEAVKRIAEEVGRRSKSDPDKKVPVIAGLARASRGDIDKAWEAIRFAEKPRIHTFLATSDIHLKHKLKIEREECLSKIEEAVKYASSLCADVEFSPEDAGRSDRQFLYKALEVAITAGATTLNIPDTVGYTTPDEFGALIAGIVANVNGVEKVTLSVHTHDDLGLATANALAGIKNGARQAEVTVNGIGERAGNASLEEVVMALKTRFPVFGLETGIDSRQLTHASKLVSNYTGMIVQPNKAVVGANAFAHEAGIHQDGMLKHHETYEIMRPEDVGLSQSRLVLGKHSGRHAFKNHLAELGHSLSEEDLAKAFERFKDLADRKKVITDLDLEAIIADEIYRPRDVFSLDGMQVACGTMGLPTATVRLRGPDGKTHTHAVVGTGPVDATYKAIDQIVKVKANLLEFNIHAITEGIDALGEVTVRIQSDEASNTMNAQLETQVARVFGGHGADPDIIVASAKAYLAALNKLLVAQMEKKSKEIQSEITLQ